MSKKGIKNILLINPFIYNASSQFNKIREFKIPFATKKATVVPLHLATIAGLTPRNINVDIWDEDIHGQIEYTTRFSKKYDIVGVTGYLYHMKRVNFLGKLFLERGVPVVAGGVGVTSAPELYRTNFNVLFIGEAEYTWPKFLQQFESGIYRKEYRQIQKVDMADSPSPRWELSKKDMKNYFTGLVQTSRGCPYNCEFCDVVLLFGQGIRKKSVEQVIEEIRVMEKLGFRSIIFCDDNFYGNHSYTKTLLHEMISLNKSLKYPMSYNVQPSIDIAKDDEILKLCRDANVKNVNIGIETPNKNSLKEVKKLQNANTDIVNDIKKIQSYGLKVNGLMIVGFDNDTTDIFQEQVGFLEESNIINFNIGLLKAVPGTKLWNRLLTEKRVINILSGGKSGIFEIGAASTNISPKNMSTIELLNGYRKMIEELTDWDKFEGRVMRMIKGVNYFPSNRSANSAIPLSEQVKTSIIGLYVYLFRMDRKSRQVANRLMSYLRKEAIPLQSVVIDSILTHMISVLTLPDMLEVLNAQIEGIKGNGLNPVTLQSEYLLSNEFKDKYKDVFPQFYHHIYQGLKDKSYSDTVIAKASFQYLREYGTDFESFKKHQNNFTKICDDMIEEDNLNVSGKVYKEQNNIEDNLKNKSHKRLSKEIMQSVTQELQIYQFLENKNV